MLNLIMVGLFERDVSIKNVGYFGFVWVLKRVVFSQRSFCLQ